MVTSNTVTYGSGHRFNRRYSILPIVGVHVLLQCTAVYITFLLPAFEVSPIPVAARSSVGLQPLACWDCRFESRQGHGSVSCECCVVSERPLRKAHCSSTGVLPSVICLPKCDLETATTWKPRSTRTLEPWTTKML